MWSPVSGTSIDNVAPSARTKHSATLVGGFVYLIGGRNGNLPLKDMWKYDIAEGRWLQLQPSGDKPPCLQEHTAVAYKDGIYVFGGEVGFSAGTETPLWYYDIKRNIWRKVKSQKGVVVPLGRRGHSALIHHGSMLIYGGYQDLRGSSNELWSFHFETESWHLLSAKKSLNGRNYSSNNDAIPPGRHKHSAVMHDDAMWIYGGMTDLQERSDLWKWCTVSKSWYQYKTKHNPGPLHSHAVCKLPGLMLIFGGESNGQPTNDLWKFNFALETWEKVQIEGLKPQPRAESIAFAVSELLLKLGTVPNEKTNTNSLKVTTRIRTRTSLSVDRTVRHATYLPQNRVTPCEKTYIFQPTTNNYIDGSDESFHKSLILNSNTTYKSAQPGSFLREIQKLSQLNLSKLSHNKCSYSVLNSTNTESTESLLRQHTAGVVEENASVTPVRNMMVKSQSEHFTNKKRLSCPVSPEQVCDTNLCIAKSSQRSCKPTTEQNIEMNYMKRKYEMTREPISVPNFSTLILPTPVLTPVEAAKLVYLDSEEDDDLQDHCNNTQQNPKDPSYDTFKPASRDESYSSHLCASIYQNIPKSASVKFQCPDLEEICDENSTSDYASVEKVNKSNEKRDESKKGILKTPASSDSPFGFANPHYMGPDIQEFLNSNNRHSWNVSNDGKAQQYAKTLNTPDSGVDVSGKSTSRHMLIMDEMVEMHHLNTRVNNEGKTQIDTSIRRLPPNTLILNNDGYKRIDKTRASSASRAERGRDNKISPGNTNNNDSTELMSEPGVKLYVFIIGGKEQGQITVFKRPISIWRLKLY